MTPTLKPHNSVTDTPWVCPELYTLPQVADFSAEYYLYRIVQQGVQRVGLLHSPRLMLYGGGCSTQERWHLQCGRRTQFRDPGNFLFISLPRATNPISLQVTLVCSPFPLLEIRVSGYEQDFVHWPYKRAAVSLADSCLTLVTESLLIFTARCDMGTSSRLWCAGLGALVWGREPTSQGEPLQLRYSSGISAATDGNGSSLFCTSILSANLDVASYVHPWLKNFSSASL